MRFLSSATGLTVRYGAVAGIVIPVFRAVAMEITAAAWSDLPTTLMLVGALLSTMILTRLGFTGPLRAMAVIPALTAVAGLFMADAVVGWLPPIPSLVLASAATAILLGLLVEHLGMGSDGERRVERVSLALGGFAVGLLASVALLPTAGPWTLLAAAALLGWPWEESARGWSWLVIPVILLLVLMWTRGFEQAEDRGGEMVAATRRWYVDGLVRKVVVSWERRVEIRGGQSAWTALPRPDLPEGLTSAKVRRIVEHAAGGGRVLVVGAAAASIFDGSRLDLTVAEGEPRRRSLVFSRPADGGAVRIEETAPADLLAERPGAFRVVYWQDDAAVDALASGTIGSRPNHFLTVETLSAALNALPSDGYLVFRGPYSLKLASLVYQVMKLRGADAGGHLLVYGLDDGPHYLAIVSKTAWTRDRLLPFDAILEGKELKYAPGVHRRRNAIAGMVRMGFPRGEFPMTSYDLKPPTRDRPFFHHLRKSWAAPDKRRTGGISPLEYHRFVAIVPPVDAPWLISGLILFLALGGVLPGIGRGVAGRSGAPGKSSLWAVAVLASSQGLIGRAMAIVADGGGIPLYQFTAVAAGGIPLLVAAAMLVRRRWEFLAVLERPAVLTLLLPLVLLPLLAERSFLFTWPLPVRLAVALLFLAPAPLVVGAFAAGWMGSAGRGTIVVPAVLTTLTAGLAFGWEFCIPLARNFGLLFSLVLGWVMIIAVSRIAPRRG